MPAWPSDRSAPEPDRHAGRRRRRGPDRPSSPSASALRALFGGRNDVVDRAPRARDRRLDIDDRSGSESAPATPREDFTRMLAILLRRSALAKPTKATSCRALRVNWSTRACAARTRSRSSWAQAVPGARAHDRVLSRSTSHLTNPLSFPVDVVLAISASAVRRSSSPTSGSTEDQGAAAGRSSARCPTPWTCWSPASRPAWAWTPPWRASRRRWSCRRPSSPRS